MIRNTSEHNETVKPNDFEMERLRAALPEYFDGDGNFMIDRFQHVLQDGDVDLTREGYELKFLGKSYAKYLTSTKTETVVVPDLEHNLKPENADSENLYIVGDNLDALKHLLGSYAGKIKCIYIDPPYNTGSDGFVYNDEFGFSAPQLVEKVGLTEDEAERVLDLRGKSSHSAWLTFMYPRLQLAKELLADDGVIFISIDENEVANLQLLGNEVFGEGNFAGEIAWKNSSKNQESYISMQHEMILAWVRDKQHNNGEWLEKKEGLPDIYSAFEGFAKEFGDDWRLIHKAALKWYKSLDDANPAKAHEHYNWMDERGIYSAQNIAGPNYGQYRYDIPHPITGKVVKEPEPGWRFPRETMEARIEKDLIVFGEDETTVPKNKVYLHDNEQQGIASVKYQDGRAATKALKSLLGGEFFTNPKNVDLIGSLINAVTPADGMVMDFFSGSASTAEAVLRRNATTDGTSRPYIMVQLSEKIDGESRSKTAKAAYQAGYRTVDQIGRERIKRAAEKIKEETGADIDNGFKLYRLDEPSGQVLDDLVAFDPEQGDMLLAADYVSKFDLNGTPGHDTVLSTWLVEDGHSLTAKTRKVNLAGYELDVCGDSAYIISPGLASDDVVELVRLLENGDLAVSRVVVFGYSVTFGVMHELKKNLSVLKSGRTVSVIERL
ncbi:DNA methyltransferase [Corynebacterium sp. HMSC072D01]|uniref:site-specific DNA-methyltransferase n=1 Tax=Corynebacterium sp. HMSC072D01 TaxID=1739403 RepID=UPI0008A84006|nr:site-specific DNA-methyltransferase [Corynebacterium sp. HMSC072D01]OHR25148.1 DNA methyltransferase [Corynebacterium sp. HMSC072D01]